MSVKITVVGDVLAHLRVNTPRLPRPHQTVPGYGFIGHGAGDGALQALTAARLGANVRFIGCVGDDVNGELVRGLLRNEGIDTAHLKTDNIAPTGLLLSFAESDSKQMSAHVVGANERLSEGQVRAAEAAIKDSDCLVLQLTVPLETARQALKIARQYGVRTVLKPTPFVPQAAELLLSVDVLTPNEAELRALATHNAQGKPVPGQINVCTLAAAGAQWFRTGEDGNVTTGRVNGFSVRKRDTTGAGMVFSAALAVALAEEQPLEDAIRFANAAGAVSTTVQGTWESAPTRDAVTALLPTPSALSTEAKAPSEPPMPKDEADEKQP